RFPRGVRQALRDDAGPGARGRGRDGRVAAHAARPDDRRRHEPRRLPARVYRPPQAGDAARDPRPPPEAAARAGRSPAAQPPEERARRVLRRGKAELRGPAARERLAVPGAGLARAPEDPVRPDLLLPGRREEDRLPDAVRAVGTANGMNRIAIVIP